MYQQGKRVVFVVSIFLIWGGIFVSNSGAEDVHSKITDLKNLIASLATASFRNSDYNLKDANLNELEAVDITLSLAEGETDLPSQDELYQDAIDSLNNLWDKADGCPLSGSPDSGDWIVDCEAQNQLYPLFEDTISIVQGY